MPQDETSEAADLAQKLRHNGSWVNWGTPLQHWAPLDESDRHAAADLIDSLTAAAQVRERADEAARKTGFDYIVSCAKPNCDGVHGVEKLVDAPHGVKAYECPCHMALIDGSAEPDNGPDVLGERKG